MDRHVAPADHSRSRREGSCAVETTAARYDYGYGYV